MTTYPYQHLSRFVIHQILDASLISSDIDEQLEKKIKQRFENRCVRGHGYVKKATIISRTPGKLYGSSLHCEVSYDIELECVIWVPSVNMRLIANVVEANEMFIFARKGPFNIFLSRDHHENLQSFDDIHEGDSIHIKVVRYDLNENNSYDIFGVLEHSISHDGNFLLPTMVQPETWNIVDNINPATLDTIQEPSVKYGDPSVIYELNKELKKMKTEKMDYLTVVRKIVNPYEMVTNPFYNKPSIIKKHVFGEGYFILTEIAKTHNIFDGEKPMTVVNFNDKTGAYTQASYALRKKRASKDTFYSTSEGCWGVELLDDKFSDFFDSKSIHFYTLIDLSVFPFVL